MIKHGMPEFLECSTMGDVRFSAFHAHLKDSGRCIEIRYQSAKVFEDGSTGLNWRDAKGRRPVNHETVARLYSHLWDRYIAENPGLLLVLKRAKGLSDVFGRKGSVCQATELWRIRNSS